MMTLKEARQWVRRRVFRALNDRDVVENEGVRLWTRHPAVTDRMFHAFSRRYERTEADLARKYLGPDSRVLEIGAGVGFIACLCRRDLGHLPYAVVEANPGLIDLIARNLDLNGAADVPVINLAVAQAPGRVAFTVSREFWASSMAHEAGEKIDIEADSLPNIMARLDFRPNTLIMDIEGFEVELPTEHFAAFDTIIMETHPSIVGADRTALMIERFRASGLTLLEERDHVIALSRI